jgi:polyisoprenoid-binding protein YceI
MSRWTIDASHSTAEFSVKHLMITNVRGRFGALTGTVAYDPADPTATTIEATIDAASIDTREPKRDEHLRSADFFDVAHHPTITFRSRAVTRAGRDLEVVGDLTIRGVTKEITLALEAPSETSKDPWGNVRIGASATARLRRKDFGLTWNQALETGGVLVGDEVKIALDVSLVQVSEAVQAA